MKRTGASSSQRSISLCDLRRAGARLWHGSAPEHHSGLDFHGFAIYAIGPELPLKQRIGNRFRLVSERADYVHVFHFAIFVDDDAHRNRIKLALSENRIDLVEHVV